MVVGVVQGHEGGVVVPTLLLGRIKPITTLLDLRMVQRIAHLLQIYLVQEAQIITLDGRLGCRLELALGALLDDVGCGEVNELLKDFLLLQLGEERGGG